ncbi:GNAT family N-acetyltransferase [Candidatus Bathyarchaeota archaeon]|nr:GNAT family N-acetyltransferase [Candidatus Bathyarchaeota archaeon]
MKRGLKTKIIDITEKREYERYLYRCFAPMPFRKYHGRQKYLERAIPVGFCKKLFIANGNAVGQIEYAPAESSGYPITGNNVVVMNCIWVLRKAKGHGFGQLLLKAMLQSQRNVEGFATIALENHWSPWLVKGQMEKLGFRSINYLTVSHTIKRPQHVFNVHLMWMPIKEDASFPEWDKKKLLQGITFCMAHPLYRCEKCKGDLLKVT